jgi:phage FluMu protein Com
VLFNESRYFPLHFLDLDIPSKTARVHSIVENREGTMDEHRCSKCKKLMMAMTDRTGRTELRCLKCDKIDPMNTGAVKWANSPGPTKAA